MNFFNLNPWIKKYIEDKKFKDWTDIQLQFLTHNKNNKNIIGISPTGTGKTLAFLLPILNSININLFSYQSIIICPTRELARQIYSVINEMKKYQSNLKATLWIGGLDLNKLIDQARNSDQSQIIICTPKRFLEVANNLKNIKFNNVKSFVLDEADMLLDLNFFKDIIEITKKLNFEEKKIWKVATSATLHNLLNDSLKQLYKNVKVINLNEDYLNSEKIKHYLIKTNDKNHALSVLLQKINPYFCIIFVNTTKKADAIYKYLLSQNYNVINLHSQLQTRQRKNNYKNIKNLQYQYVVASDLVSRGLDIDGASHVISYDLPQNIQWYIHRSGRVGRSKYDGESYILYKPNDLELFKKLEKEKINFKVFKIKDNDLVGSKIKTKKYTSTNTEQNQEIKKIILQSNKKVKPGYKKKLKNEIHKIKQKYKHQYIDKLLKEKRKKQYIIKK